MDNTDLTYSLVDGAGHGTVNVDSDGTYSYTPDANYFGDDSFTFQANDGELDSNVATVSLTVNPVNDAPVANDASASTDEDTPLDGILIALDVDNTDLTYSLVDGAGHGTVNVDSDGNYSYTPDANYFGDDSFTFQANDGELDSNVATVSLTVNPVNDAPVANDDTGTTDEDTPLDGILIALDVDNTDLSFSLVDGAGHGTVNVDSDGTYSYTPDANYFGGDSFTFKANDGSLDSNVATVSLTVNPVNDAPVANDDTGTTDEDTPLNGMLVALDVENDALSFSLVDDAGHGTVNVDSDGTYSYTPDANYFGDDSFTFKANDGELDSNVATVSLTVNPVNDAPVANDASARDRRGHPARRHPDCARCGQHRPQLQPGGRRGPRHGERRQRRQLQLHAGRELLRRRQLHVQGQRRRARFERRHGLADGQPGQRRAGGGRRLGEHRRRHPARRRS